MIECSLCGIQFNDKVKVMLDEIKARHEEYHTNTTGGQRHGQNKKRWMIKGKVQWIKK
jgi:hypothetical protein